MAGTITPPYTKSYVEDGNPPPTPTSVAHQQNGQQQLDTQHHPDARRPSENRSAGFAPTHVSNPDTNSPPHAKPSRQYWHWIKDSTGNQLTFGNGKVNYLKEDYLHILGDLTQQKINDIHIHLWWVGRPGNIRPLHHQKAMFRDIVITERPYLHMVWFEDSIFLKPLPEYLLDRNFFEEKICPHEDLFELACGLMYSYSKLIVHKSDHKIAMDEGLLPEYMDWVSWCGFAKDIQESVNFKTINKRYRYGELRLKRLNHVYRFCKGEPRGFYSLDRGYNSFFKRNFGWLVGLFAFLTIILTAMQVVLATGKGQVAGQGLFEEVSYVFGVVSIVIPVVGTGTALALFFTLFWWNVVITLMHRKDTQTKRKLKELQLEADLEMARPDDRCMHIE